MRKFSLLIVCLTLVASSYGSLAARLSSFAKGGAGAGTSAGVTPAVGNVFSERFTTGYSHAGWTDVNTTLTTNDTIPAGSGLSTPKSLKVIYAGGAGQPYNRNNVALGAATSYYRFYIYVDSSSMVNTDKSNIFQVNETSTDGTISTDVSFAVRLFNSAGTYKLQLIDHGNIASTGQTVSLATWYRVEARYVPNTATTGITVRVYDSTGTQVGTDETATSANWNQGYVFFGTCFHDNTDAVTIHYAAFDISNVGYVGP